LLYLEDLLFVERRDAVALGVADLLQQYARTVWLTLERGHVRRDAVLEDIVAQDHAYALARRKVASEGQRMRDSVGAFLDLVAQAAAELVATAEAAHHVSHVLGARDGHDVTEPGVHELPDRVVQHRLGADRQQML